jgi:pimeloyl-ACP methyl ester carboxylesterase
MVAQRSPDVLFPAVTWTYVGAAVTVPGSGESPALQPRVRLTPAVDGGGGRASPVHIDVNGTRLWFDVDGLALVPDGNQMRQRPTVVLVHGAPGVSDHSYFKPDFARLTEHAQVVYLDLRGHGRSAWGQAAAWSFEACADDIRVFCDTAGITRPIVLGHSMGGPIVLLYGACHPDTRRAHHPIRVRPVGPAADGRGLPPRGRRGGRTDRAAQLRR